MRRLVETPVDPESLAEYGRISIAFTVESHLELGPLRERPPRFVEAPVAPYLKDYDGYEGEGPARWGRRFDTSSWAMLRLFAEDVPLGGAVLAWRTPGVDMLEGRDDLAVLWDLRVAPAFRAAGVGRALIEGAVAWAGRRGVRELKVETQQVNARACRFYARQGFQLAQIEEGAYGEPLAGEAQLIWRLRLDSKHL